MTDYFAQGLSEASKMLIAAHLTKEAGAANANLTEGFAKAAQEMTVRRGQGYSSFGKGWQDIRKATGGATLHPGDRLSRSADGGWALQRGKREVASRNIDTANNNVVYARNGQMSRLQEGGAKPTPPVQAAKPAIPKPPMQPAAKPAAAASMAVGGKVEQPLGKPVGSAAYQEFRQQQQQKANFNNANTANAIQTRRQVNQAMTGNANYGMRSKPTGSVAQTPIRSAGPTQTITPKPPTQTATGE